MVTIMKDKPDTRKNIWKSCNWVFALNMPANLDNSVVAIGGLGRGQFSFESQRRAMPKKVQTATQLHSFHILAR